MGCIRCPWMAWEHLKEYIAALPQGARREIQHFERIRYLFHFLYLLAPRVSEIASHSMNSSREFRGKWWWFVDGKGGKRAGVPPIDEMIYRLVKDIVIEAADNIEAETPVSARKLRSASTHWFRHTAITHGDDSGIGIKFIQASARHDKLETTAIYQHAEDAKWHDEWQRLRY